MVKYTGKIQEQDLENWEFGIGDEEKKILESLYRKNIMEAFNNSLKQMIWCHAVSDGSVETGLVFGDDILDNQPTLHTSVSELMVEAAEDDHAWDDVIDTLQKAIQDVKASKKAWRNRS